MMNGILMTHLQMTRFHLALANVWMVWAKIKAFMVMPRLASKRAMVQIQVSSLLTVVPSLALPPTPIRTRQLRKAPVTPTKHNDRANSRPSCQVQVAISAW